MQTSTLTCLGLLPVYTFFGGPLRRLLEAPGTLVTEGLSLSTVSSVVFLLVLNVGSLVALSFAIAGCAHHQEKHASRCHPVRIARQGQGSATRNRKAVLKSPGAASAASSSSSAVGSSVPISSPWATAVPAPQVATQNPIMDEEDLMRYLRYDREQELRRRISLSYSSDVAAPQPPLPALASPAGVGGALSPAALPGMSSPTGSGLVSGYSVDPGAGMGGLGLTFCNRRIAVRRQQLRHVHAGAS